MTIEQILNQNQNATVGDAIKAMGGLYSTMSKERPSQTTYVGMAIVTDTQKASKIIDVVMQVTGCKNPFKISKQDPHKMDRSIEYAEPRHAIRYFIHKQTRLSLKAIGRLTGGADHSTILNSVGKYQDWIDTDKRIKAQAEQINKLLWFAFKREINPSTPTQKPVELYDFCLNFAKLEQGDLILDTHLGSGSSRIAAYKGGFNFVGFEIDQEYYDKQEKRFNDFKSQLRLF